MRSILTDYRIAGVPRDVVAYPEELMQLPPEIRRCVCFVVGTQGNKRGPIGTAFFVSMRVDEERDEHFVYAVTARHVLYPSDNPDERFDRIELRLNTHDGLGSIETPLHVWQEHPTADVAAVALAPGQAKYRYLHYPIAAAAGADKRATLGIEAGEDLVMTGLLANHPGTTENVPVIRVGNISAFPKDPIRLSHGAGKESEDHVILAEVRSIGGLSGSPVFIHYGYSRWDPAEGLGSLRPDTVDARAGPNYLLGLMHGYFNLTAEARDIPRFVEDGEPLNTGIGVVVAVDRIEELILHNKVFQDGREVLMNEHSKKNRPRPTRSLVTTEAETDAQKSEFQEFEDLARKLLNVPKQEVDEKRREKD